MMAYIIIKLCGSSFSQSKVKVGEEAVLSSTKNKQGSESLPRLGLIYKFMI